MTNPVSSGAATSTPISQVLGNTAGATNSVKAADMGKDDFLKLLVAQLKYQDPSNPADSTQFLAQTAQFTQLEKLDALAKSNEALVTAQLSLGASNLIGKSITYTGLDGNNATGVVTSATLGSDPMVKIGDTEVALSKVKEVHK